MMVFGVAIMLMNQMSLRSRKSYTTVTGKSGQTSKINLWCCYDRNTLTLPRRLYGNTNRRSVLPSYYSFSVA